MALLDIFRRRVEKSVTDDTKYMTSSIGVIGGGERGKSAPFSMVRSVNSFSSWVYAASTLNAQAVASVPLRLYVRTDAQAGEKIWRTRPVDRARKSYLMGDSSMKPSVSVMKSATMAGDFEEVTDAHPLLELLRTANKYEDGFGLAVSRILFLELTGNAYLHVVTDPKLGIPSSLWTVPAQHVTIKPGKTDLIEAYLYGQSLTSMQSFTPDEIIHFRRPNPRSLYYGMGKVEGAWASIAQNDAVHEQDLAFAQNMSRPDYAAIIKGGASAESMRRFEQSMQELHQGSRKSGRMVAISGDISLVPLSFPAKDLGGRDEIVEEIASVFGVPVSMLKANDPNLASAQSGYSMWRETTIAPICRLDEETLNARLLPLFGIEGDAYLAYDNPVPSNRLADSSERTSAVAGGWRTPNEARLEEGYAELDTPHASMLHVNGMPLGGPTPVSPFAFAVAPPAEKIVELPQLPPIVEVEPESKALSDVDTTPTDEMAELAQRGLELRGEYNRGGTEVGVARARDISNMVSLSPDTVGRMASFFARHRVDLDAVGARSGDEGYPSAGAIAWMLWGGDPNNPDGAGAGWAERKVEELASESKGELSAIAREEKMARARIKIASLEAKAWDAIHQQPKIDALTADLAEMRERTKSLDEIVTLMTEAIGDEA